MKDIIFLFSLLLFNAQVIKAQNVYEHLSADSMNNSPNPGRYFVNYLTSFGNLSSTDSIEGDEKHKAMRQMSFWQDRIPVGNDLTNPFLKYNDALKHVRGTQCNLPQGVFNGNWENIGPKIVGQQMQGLVVDTWIDPKNADIIFVGVQDGGLWKTINGGLDWTCVSDLFLNNGSIGVECMVFNPNNSDEIYAGTNTTGNDSRNYIGWFYGQGIWHSTNGGNSWTMESNIPSTTIPQFQRSMLMEIAPFQINGGSDEFILMTEGDNLFSKKVDGSTMTAWDKIPFPTTLPILGTEYREITMFMHNGVRKAFLSTNGGWHSILGVEAPGRFFELTFDASGGLTSWIEIPINNGNPVSFGIYGSSLTFGLETAYKGNGILYVMVAAAGPVGEKYHALLQYDIAGGPSAWTLVFSGWSPHLWDTRWCMEIEVDQNNPEVIYYGRVTPCRISKIPGTSNWQINELQPANSNVCHADIRKIVICHSENTPSNPGINDIVYWGNDGGLSKSVGNTFSNLNGNNFYTTQTYDVGVSPIEERIASAVYHTGVNATREISPNSWDGFFMGDGFDTKYDKRNTPAIPVMLLHANDPWTRYEHTPAGLNTSGTFTEPVVSPKESPRGYPFAYDFDKDNTIMYMANANMSSSTTPGGVPWTNQTNTGFLTGDAVIGGAGTSGDPFDICRSIAIAKSNSSSQYYGMRREYNQSQILWERHAPTNVWTNITPPQIFPQGRNLTDIVVDPADEKRVFISLGGINWGNPGVDRVLVSNNHGATGSWVDMSTGLSELPVTCLVYQNGSDDVIYAGTDAGVYRWDKPTQCWIHFNDSKTPFVKIPNVLVNDLEIDYCSGKLVAAAYGRGIWQTDLYNLHTPSGIILPGVTETILPSVGGTSWNSTRYVEGSVLVKSGATLYINGTPTLTPPYTSSTIIHMPKYGAIYVERGAKLYVQGAEITNTCDFWYGIQAFGFNSEQVYSTSTGFGPDHGLVYLNKAIISNAEEAFTNAGGNPIGSSLNSGGIIQAHGSVFYNNRRSAQFLSYKNWNAQPPGNLQKDLSYFADNLFLVDNNMKEELTMTQVFSAHITMWDVNGIELTGNEFRNEQNLNQSHQTAINTLDASYQIDDNLSFSADSKIEGFYQGIRSQSFSLGLIGEPISIKNTEFDKNEIGLYLTNMHYPKIISNDIKIGAKQTPIPPGAGYQYYSLGSKLDYVSDFVYCNNTHNKLYNPPTGVGLPPCTFHYTAGTEIQNSGEGDQEVEKNSYTSLLIGTDCDGKCATISGSTGINFRCNTNFGNTNFDYIFQDNPRIRKVQSFGLSFPKSATRNTFSLGSTIHWRQASGGNAPVDYFYNPVAIETPINVVTTNINRLSAASVVSCNLIQCQSVDVDAAYARTITNNDFQNLKNNFYSSESSYKSYNDLYNQLIDLGDTEGIISDIENGTSSEAMNIRAEMLAMSPYVSRDVLQTLVNEAILPNAYLLEIIIANPDASRDENFLEFLANEAPNPFPAFMITLIQNSWDGSTLRTNLEENISIQHQEMTRLKNDIITIIRVMPDFYIEDSILVWMKKVPTLRNSYNVIEYLLNKKDYAQSLSILSNLPYQYRFSDYDNIEHNAYIQLYNFKKDLLETNKTINQLDSPKIIQLQNIANMVADCFSREMARSALCFFYNICYSDGDRVLPLPSQSRKLQIESKSLDNRKEIIAYPNPAKEYVVFYFDLLNKNEVSEIAIVDMMGKPIYKTTLKGAIGQHIWDTRLISNGQYIYSISTVNGEKYSGKITVQKIVFIKLDDEAI